jgi:hypothetical protein
MSDELNVSAIVPSFGSTLRCRPLLRWLPWVGSPASQLLLRHSDFLLPLLAHFRSLGGSALQRRSQDLPSSSATLATHAPVNDPGGAYPSRPPGLRPYVLLSRCCLPSPPTRRPPQIPYFGARFRSLRARCLRFVSVVTFRSRKTRFRLAALPWPSGISTRWVAYLVSVCSGYMTHLQDEAYLAHGGGRRAVGCRRPRLGGGISSPASDHGRAGVSPRRHCGCDDLSMRT